MPWAHRRTSHRAGVSRLGRVGANPVVADGGIE
jgi:hypothetical protein